MKKLDVHPKVAAGGQIGAVLTVLLWVAVTYGHVDPPAYVVAALVTLANGLGSWFRSSPAPLIPVKKAALKKGVHP